MNVILTTAQQELRPPGFMIRVFTIVNPIIGILLAAICVAEDRTSDPRPPRSEQELRGWLENMVWYHRLTADEIRGATGLSDAELQAALTRFEINDATRPVAPAGGRLRVLPYPGGRHPRIGFLEGAIRPQRETKVSVFTPWDESSYVVVDVPEAIWSNLGLTYLAHTHVPTIWEVRGMTLVQQEWQVQPDGALTSTRKLPNGIEFRSVVVAQPDHVAMEMTLTNGTAELLTDLRVQNCVMLKAATGFAAQTNDNKLFSGRYVACHDQQRRRWVITAWEPLHRVWANPPCPCLHSDPKFPDCPPGSTQRLKGWLSFYEGDDIQAELARIDATNWHGNP